MRIPIEEWSTFQKKMIQNQKESQNKKNISDVPRIIHIGIEVGYGMVEIVPKLVSEEEWIKFAEIWIRITGASNPNSKMPQCIPQFFLICN